MTWIESLVGAGRGPRLFLLLGTTVAGCAPPKDSPSGSASGGDSVPADSGAPADDCPDGEQTWFADVDGDGFGNAATAQGGCDAPAPGFVTASGDCNDEDPAVHPEAPELWYDGVDQDCAGDSDYDADMDGVDASEHGGTDCDDADETVSPGAVEVWYDGVDQDCGGDSDYDADGDSHNSSDHDGDDCDDMDATVFPGAQERLGDGVRSDCSGLYEHLFTTEAVATRFSSNTGGNAGHSIAAGDLNGDGYDDLVIGEPGIDGNGMSGVDAVPGQAHVLFGPLSGVSDLATGSVGFTGFASHDEFGNQVAVIEDVDGEGTPAVVVAAEGSNLFERDGGAVHVFHGSPTGTRAAEAAELTIAPTAEYDYLGQWLDTGVSEDGDGVDLLVGAYRADDGGVTDGGAAYLFRDVGALSGTVSVGDASVTIAGSDVDGRIGWTVALAGDITGDGTGELVVAGTYDGATGNDRGIVHLIDGQASGLVLSADSDRRWEGTTADDNIGQGLAGGDVNGDGYGDLWFSAKNDDHGGYGSGSAWLILGDPSPGGMPEHEYLDSSGSMVTAAHARITGELAEDRLGSRLLSVGDLDDDGHDDIVLAAHRADVVPPGESEEVTTGAVYVLYGPMTGTINASAATDAAAAAPAVMGGRISGLVASGRLGSGLAVGDFGGDGRLDLAVSADDDGTGAGAAGAAYVFSGVFR